jgi:hypothetical protein
MNVTGHLAVETVFAEAKRLASAAWGESAIYLVATLALAMAVDLNGWGGGGDFLVSIVNFVLGYILSVAMLRKGGLLDSGQHRGLGTYFVVSLLSGVGIAFGALLLIVPGIVLLIRWLPAYGFALADDLNASEALSHSWNMTRPHFWTLLLAALVPMALFVSGAMSYYLAFSNALEPSIVGLVFANLALGVAAVTFTAVGLASYSLVREGRDGLPEVFA